MSERPVVTILDKAISARNWDFLQSRAKNSPARVEYHFYGNHGSILFLDAKGFEIFVPLFDFTLGRKKLKKLERQANEHLSDIRWGCMERGVYVG